ncbi:radical SAM protein [Thermosphaera chiliense]|uniref:Radical SAM protein n=2 Tax=Thermosphaera chiliense TaxID=3402707 RepID=A0A7M1UP36_9CREN|nr:radical SAM protein [Thermosphaera aggregans]
MELNTVYKNPLKASSRVAFIYPSLYEVMISSLASDLIYFTLNNNPEIYAERFCNKRLTGAEEEARSIETRSPLRDFDLIITSIHYEPDIVNLVRLLQASGVNPFREARQTPIIAGGPVVMANPIPFSDLIDVFVIGEVESSLDKIVEIWLQFKGDKKAFLEEVSKLSYVYVPGLTEGEVVKSYPADLNACFYPVRQIVNTKIEPVFGRGFKLEVNRGCMFACSFCMETRVMAPYRERSLGLLKKLIEEHLTYNPGEKRVVLYSLSFPVRKDHLRILEFMVENNLIASQPSIRLDLINEELLELLRALNQKTITIAPESFSLTTQKLFFKYVKPCEWFEEKIGAALSKGFNVKIYLVYGAPWEGLESIKENIECLKRVISKAKGKRWRAVVSLNPLIPKPHTPFQYFGMKNMKELKQVFKIYKENLKGLVESRAYDIEWSLMQAFLSLSEKPLGKLIATWAEEGGGLHGFKKVAKGFNIDLSRVFNGYRFEETLPWSFIKIPYEKSVPSRIQAEIIYSFMEKARRLSRE